VPPAQPPTTLPAGTAEPFGPVHERDKAPVVERAMLNESPLTEVVVTV
jgi:hypothetical protein